MTDAPTTTATAAVQTVDRFYAHVLAGELPEAAALYAPDAVLRIPESLSYGGRHLGREGLLQVLGGLYGRAEIDFVRGPLLPLGSDRAVAFNRFDRILLRDNPGGGAAVDLCEVYTVVDGAITTCEVWYWDTAALQAALPGL